ncbi:MAG: response regulator transcription factor [Ignavibacteriales bacterium]|nr:MAG: Response regulator [Stygiobacter sp.]KAF0216621.1 MAG: Response [Ignavibacteria bacterium]MBI3124125.1 response regulator transcription factor [Ignavibacteriales bacterium]OGU68622.1 MAG: DNA-binding response regulator [Stygiobacter sp. GWC2_38_9]OGU81700.1 MAG: DNA-binding response regulator [Stygiobacter sp. RIFOXYA12_FULL_38_9]OGV05804.1 MAG: DNA-binding response regulator [Stygiobacter sp. RIFOXYB2_FULL_37_11]OGV13012.1 MAG: DNA-binding response regulator [Stygiobacter sp. RIFOXYC
MIKVVITEDNNTIREGLAALINGTPGYSCVGAFSECESFLAKIPTLPADVVLMDIGLPGMSGIDGIVKAKKMRPELNILMLTVYEDSQTVFKALCAGACGYLVKKTPPARLLDAIKDANDGGAPMSSLIARQVIDVFKQTQGKQNEEKDTELSSREKEVLTSLSDGNNYQEIADRLFISVDTVRHHIKNIYRKLHVHSQSEAVAKAIRKGII